MAFGGADLSTVDPNPSVDDYSQTSPGTDWSSVLNTAGQWGSTIASIVTGNKVAVAPTAGGGYQAVGVAGSGAISNSSSQLLLIGIVVVAIVLLMKK
jgi:hypothetical protein